MKHELGDKARIVHIIEAISDIEIILKDISDEDFLNNREKCLAVERLLEIIGEATNHVSEAVLYKKDNSTPWKQIINTRNVIAHEYFRIDYDIIYKIATNNIIPLKKVIENILKELDK